MVGYRAKQAGKQVTYNDHLRFNALFGRALIENSSATLGSEDMAFILGHHDNVMYVDTISCHFRGIYFPDAENQFLDRTVANIHAMKDPKKHALAFFALCQAALSKRPYNLFHRKNLYMRLADVERSFGNKATWERPFEEAFNGYVREANAAVFDNGRPNRALNEDVAMAPTDHDLVYFDPPYMNGKGVGVDYREFYHFLEGMAHYDVWPQLIDSESRHRRLKPLPNPWNEKASLLSAFERVVRRFEGSKIVLSYRGDGFPSIDQLRQLLASYKLKVASYRVSTYQYALSKNHDSAEYLLVAT